MIMTLTGPNTYLIAQTVRVLEQQFREKHGQLSIERVSAEDLSIEDLDSLLQGVTLFAPERLVVMRDVASAKSLAEIISERLEAVPTEITLVFHEPTLDKRTKLYKQLKKISDFREFQTLNEKELITWMQQQATTYGAKLDFQTAQYLMESMGADQWRLSQELQKLANYNSTISKQAIDELLDPTLQATAFEVLDAALARQADRLQQLLHRLAGNEDPYRFFGLLVSQVLALAVVQNAGKRSVDVIAKDAGLHPFVVRKTQALLRSSPLDLLSMIAALAICDEQLKSSGVDPWILLEQCLGKMAAV
jgi:DNA polymerase III delta subunit